MILRNSTTLFVLGAFDRVLYRLDVFHSSFAPGSCSGDKYRSRRTITIGSGVFLRVSTPLKQLLTTEALFQCTYLAQYLRDTTSKKLNTVLLFFSSSEWLARKIFHVVRVHHMDSLGECPLQLRHLEIRKPRSRDESYHKYLVVQRLSHIFLTASSPSKSLSFKTQ